MHHTNKKFGELPNFSHRSHRKHTNTNNKKRRVFTPNTQKEAWFETLERWKGAGWPFRHHTPDRNNCIQLDADRWLSRSWKYDIDQNILTLKRHHQFAKLDDDAVHWNTSVKIVLQAFSRRILFCTLMNENELSDEKRCKSFFFFFGENELYTASCPQLAQVCFAANYKIFL